MRASRPCCVSPVWCVTPINVPALSNTSTNKMEKMTITKVMSNRREKSSCNRVGAIDGGNDTMPINLASPNGIPNADTTKMPMRVAPSMRRKFRAAISTKPNSIR